MTVVLIARRSRHFAGARFLKRGVSERGFVANDVETEQIVFTGTATGGRKHSYTAYVQNRGSIPLFWSQDITGLPPKPPISLTLRDPYYKASGKHFAHLCQRYGHPLVLLNLVKQKESFPRESILGSEYEYAVEYLNSFIDDPLKKIEIISWDMSRAKKKFINYFAIFKFMCVCLAQRMMIRL